MEKIIIETPGSRSEIMTGADWKLCNSLIPSEGVVILTDENVRHLYGSGFPDAPVLVLKPGEPSKQLAVIEEMASRMLGMGVDRSGFLLAIGGGVVSDIGGFLASIYMRGIRCGYVSTTLLSQVDASTGGKNGVDLAGTKNILGTFRQPEFVICDQGMLTTLPEEEYLSGLAELIKTAVIGDRELFVMIENNYGLIMKRDRDLLTDLVARSVNFKASVVRQDEKEGGLRRILNFGHTYGHAIEMQMHFKHGYAVAAGMDLAAAFSFEKGYCGKEDTERISGMLDRFGLLKEYEVPVAMIGSLIQQDKKKAGKDINFIFTAGIGKAFAEKVPADELVGFYKQYKGKR